MDRLRRIRESIQAIANAGSKHDVLFTAKVVSITGDTCTVEHNDMELTGVRLSAVVDASTSKKLIKPKKNSQVLVADLSNGGLRDLAVVQVSETDSIIWNGGELGGIPIVKKIEDNLKSLKDFVEAMNDALPGAFSAVGSSTAANGSLGGTNYTTAMTGKTISFVDMEDTKIKH